MLEAGACLNNSINLRARFDTRNREDGLLAEKIDQGLEFRACDAACSHHCQLNRQIGTSRLLMLRNLLKIAEFVEATAQTDFPDTTKPKA